MVLYCCAMLRVGCWDSKCTFSLLKHNLNSVIQTRDNMQKSKAEALTDSSELR